MYSIQVVVLLALRWVVYRLKRWHYYLYDFCYFGALACAADLAQRTPRPRSCMSPGFPVQESRSSCAGQRVKALRLGIRALNPENGVVRVRRRAARVLMAQHSRNYEP